MIVLICGGRRYGSWERVRDTLSDIHLTEGIERVISGGAPGADLMAEKWAHLQGVPHTPYRIRRRQGENGFVRNARMWARERRHVDLVIAFPGGNGTADMVRRAKRAGTPVREVVD